MYGYGIGEGGEDGIAIVVGAWVFGRTLPDTERAKKRLYEKQIPANVIGSFSILAQIGGMLRPKYSAMMCCATGAATEAP